MWSEQTGKVILAPRATSSKFPGKHNKMHKKSIFRVSQLVSLNPVPVSRRQPHRSDQREDPGLPCTSCTNYLTTLILSLSCASS
mmetsp:Transcript_3116/g.4179  ORF Transcript_3116/g.4179 Transcript_3116/m.4179 type:complete len:84 (-) Transcript_3116:49-300(-)